MLGVCGFFSSSLDRLIEETIAVLRDLAETGDKFHNFFQIKCVRFVENEMNKIGINSRLNDFRIYVLNMLNAFISGLPVSFSCENSNITYSWRIVKIIVDFADAFQDIFPGRS